MVDLIWSAIAFCSGLLVYLAIPLLGDMYPIEVRERIGQFYLGLFARAYKQWAIVRRVLGTYDVLGIDVDAEHKRMEVTLDGSIVGSDKTHPFNDPDNRIGRYLKKPMAITYEKVPAAVDAELAEVGHWVEEKARNEGLNRTTPDDEPPAADPYVRMDDGLRLVDPADAHALVDTAVSPENLHTAKELTKRRFDEYGGDIGVIEAAQVLTGFVVGVGTMVGIAYARSQFLDQPINGGGVSGNPIPIPPSGMIDVVVSLL